jgi:hypothetical protein
VISETSGGSRGDAAGQLNRPPNFFPAFSSLSSARKTFRALFEVLGSRRNPLKAIFVVQTFQNAFG